MARPPYADPGFNDPREEDRQRRSLDLLRRLMANPTANVGTLRDVLAAGDTAAFPPAVLSTPVSWGKTAMPHVVGQYHQLNKNITLSNQHRGAKYSTPGLPWWYYRTLLHEAAHARGFTALEDFAGPEARTFSPDFRDTRVFADTTSVEWLRKLRSLITGLTEKSADTLADSLLGTSSESR